MVLPKASKKLLSNTFKNLFKNADTNIQQTVKAIIDTEDFLADFKKLYYISTNNLLISKYIEFFIHPIEDSRNNRIGMLAQYDVSVKYYTRHNGLDNEYYCEYLYENYEYIKEAKEKGYGKETTYSILDLINDIDEKVFKFYIHIDDLLFLYQYALEKSTDQPLLFEFDFDKNRITVDKKLKIKISDKNKIT